MTHSLPAAGDRRGMTLVELMVAMVVLMTVVGVSLAYLRQQTMALDLSGGRMLVSQTHRFAISTMRRDIRTLGSGVHPLQPGLVYAGADAVIFNADYATNQTHDVNAVYMDTAAEPGAVTALRRNQRTQLVPGTSFSYPDTTYLENGETNSPAETIAFYFLPDATTSRTDDFVLYRRVNVEEPEVVARNLLRTGGQSFFEYLRERAGTSSAPASLAALPNSSLPLRHSAPIHGRVNGSGVLDTGRIALIDTVAAVRVRLTASNGRVGAREITRPASFVVRLDNVGTARAQLCGDAPQRPGTASASWVLVGGQRVVQLNWNASVDDRSGEKDVMRYLVWRKTTGAPSSAWGEPAFSVAPGNASYSYQDREAMRDSSYVYQVATQDCTPSLSSRVTSSPANWNPAW